SNLILARAHLALGERTTAYSAFSRAVHIARATGQRRAFSLVPIDAFTDLARGDESVLRLRVPLDGERALATGLAPLVHARGGDDRGNQPAAAAPAGATGATESGRGTVGDR